MLGLYSAGALAGRGLLSSKRHMHACDMAVWVNGIICCCAAWADLLHGRQLALQPCTSRGMPSVPGLAAERHTHGVKATLQIGWHGVRVDGRIVWQPLPQWRCSWQAYCMHRREAEGLRRRQWRQRGHPCQHQTSSRAPGRVQPCDPGAARRAHHPAGSCWWPRAQSGGSHLGAGG